MDEPALIHGLASLRTPPADRCCGATMAPASGEWRSGQRGVRTDWVGWWCPICRRHRSLTAGTFLHRNRLPLWLWDVVIEALQTPTTVLAIADRANLGLGTVRAMIIKLRAAGLTLDKLPHRLHQSRDAAWAALLTTREP